MNLFSTSKFARGTRSKPSLLSRTLLLEINRRLSTESSYRELLDLLFTAIDEILPCDRIGIALVEGPQERRVLNLKWLRAKTPVNYLNLCYSAEIKGSSLEKVLSSGVPRILNDLHEYYKTHPNSVSTQLILKDGVQSNLTFPLQVGGKKIGVVFFSSFNKNTYSLYHVEMLSEFAEELAMIVNQMRMAHDLQVQKQMTRNFNMVVHDLKSPLSTIQGFIDLVESEVWFSAIPKEGRHFFEIIKRNLDSMFDLLNDLLVNAELDRQPDVFVSGPVNLEDFFNECIAKVRELAQGKKIELRTAKLTSVEFARFDHRQISRAVQNLISNAIKYSKEPIKIELELTSDDNNIIFSIRDSGLGIPENEISKLFQDFGKTSVRPVRGESSTGLGLSIVKKIIEQHSGKVSVSSQFGEGSTFKFSIPLVRN